jgi:hypothetical protein
VFEFLKKQGLPGPADPQLLEAVKAYVDAHFVPEPQKELSEEAPFDAFDADESVSMGFQRLSDEEEARFDYAPVEQQKKFAINHSYSAKKASYSMSAPAAAPAMGSAVPKGLDDILRHTDAGFSETLLKLIDRSGEKDSTIYKRANVDRRLFSKIRSNPDYKPSKSTAVAFAVALCLDLEETNDLIGRAGYVLSHSSAADLIAEFFINNKNYDIGKLNEVLYACDQPLLGGA